MAITTRFGSPVRIVGRGDDFLTTGIVVCEWLTHDGQPEPNMQTSPVHMSDLKADGGIQEIHNAAEDSPILSYSK